MELKDVIVWCVQVQMINIAKGESNLDAGLESLIGINSLYVHTDLDSIMQSNPQGNILVVPRCFPAFLCQGTAECQNLQKKNLGPPLCRFPLSI